MKCLVVLSILITLLCVNVHAAPHQFPVYPFTREFNLTVPPKDDIDIYILKNFLTRSTVRPYTGAIDKTWTRGAADCLAAFQKAYKLPRADGVFDANTAAMVLEKLSRDNYVDHGIQARDLGAKYKLFVPVYANRSIETTATLFDEVNNPLYSFTVRAHGHAKFGPEAWPSYSNGFGLNEFSSGGNTPTGLAWFDLNSPEPDPNLYGPYNVNRVTLGIAGNAKFLYPYARNGILLHTGKWPNWDPSLPMPDSSGCLHAHPESIKRISEILTEKLGVVARPNPLGKLPYPFLEQGLVSIQQID